MREGQTAPEEVLTLIAATGTPVTIGTIAAELVCSVSTARRHVQRLAGRDWVAARPRLRGALTVDLTDAGRAAERDGERL